jgi:subtilisin family serine protease
MGGLQEGGDTMPVGYPMLRMVVRCISGCTVVAIGVVCSTVPLDGHMVPQAAGRGNRFPTAVIPQRIHFRRPDQCRPSTPLGNVVTPTPCPLQASAPEQPYVPGELLVKFKRGVTNVARQRHHAEADAEVLSEIHALGVDRVRSRRGETTESLRARYRKFADVEYAEPNVIIRAQVVPNDPSFGLLWGLYNTGQSGGRIGADISAPEAWDLQTGSTAVLVADLDTGVDDTHPDLDSNIWTNAAESAGNGKDDDGNGYIDDVHGWDFVNQDNDPTDDYGHGTHTAGIIGAVGNNGAGVVGVAWRTAIMPLKILNAQGSGTIADAASALLYAVQMGARISNNSWGCQGTDCYSQTFQDALTVAAQHGMLFVSSAGNNESNNDQVPVYPCSYTAPNVICVSATDQNDQLAYFSNYGASTVHLGAPGVSIMSTVPTGPCPLCDPTGYRFLDGTSMAAPYVAGTAALALAQFPFLTVAQLKQVILDSLDPIPALAHNTASGGRLNAGRAVWSNFLIESDQPDQSTPAGESVSSSVAVTSLTGLSGSVVLSVTSQDPAISGQVTPSSVTPAVLGSSSVTLTIDTTAGMPAGHYQVMISGTNGAGETHAFPVTLAIQTDLSMTEISGPSGGETGKWIVVTSSVMNRGPAAANGFYVGYYLSTDQSITTADVRIGSRWVPALPSGSSDSATTVVWIPTSLAEGGYYLGAIADDQRYIPEAAALDNALSGQAIYIRAGVFDSPLWESRYDGPAHVDDEARAMLRDASGDVYVAGYSISGLYDNGRYYNTDYTLIQYNADGQQQWVARYDDGAADYATALAVDGLGNVFITGYSENQSGYYDIATLKYDSGGQMLWDRRFETGYTDGPSALAVDPAGNLVVVGEQGIVKYAPDGTVVWSKIFGRGGKLDFAFGLAIDPSGNLFVAGLVCRSPVCDVTHAALVKYDGNGDVVWSGEYTDDRNDVFLKVSLDASGAVYAAGDSVGTTFADSDFLAVKYDAGGTRLWAARYDNGGRDAVRFSSVDTYGQLYVTGVSDDGVNQNDATVKYDTAGRRLWVARYSNGAYEDAPTHAVDAFGNVYITGMSAQWARRSGIMLTFSPDYATLIFSSNGDPLWVARYGGSNVGDSADALSVDETGSIYVTGWSYNPIYQYTDMTTVKYASPLNFAILSVVKSGNGDGTVTSAPDAIHCGAICRAGFPIGTEVTLSATTTSKSEFSGWSGDADCADGVVTMSAAVTCMASFTDVDQPPVFDSIGDKVITVNQALIFSVSASDPDGDPLTYDASGLPAGAAFSPSTRLFTWTPAYSQSGTYVVTFTVSDGDLTTIQHVSITVNSAPHCTGTGAYELDGNVKMKGKPMAGVTMTVEGPGGCVDTTTTDSMGLYRFPALGTGSYTVTPAQLGYAFTPARQTRSIRDRRHLIYKFVNFSATPTSGGHRTRLP